MRIYAYILPLTSTKEHTDSSYNFGDNVVRKCDRCSYEGTSDSFPRKRNGSGNLKICFACNNKQIAKKAAAGQGNLDVDEAPNENTALDFGECMRMIASNKVWPYRFDAFVRLTQEDMDGMWQGGADAFTHARSNAVREKISAASGYHWK